MLGIFKQVGFQYEVQELDRWDSIPTPRAKMNQVFRSCSDDDLAVKSFTVVLT
jgi:hypothetical protein